MEKFRIVKSVENGVETARVIMESDPEYDENPKKKKEAQKDEALGDDPGTNFIDDLTDTKTL